MQVARQRSTEVTEKPERRRFTVEYKADILRRTDAVELGSGELGELLRKEGLYSSILSVWRRQRDAGVIAGLASQKRGRKAKRRDPVTVENEKLRRELAQVRQRLEQAEIIIEVQKKISQLLGIPVAKIDGENGSNE
jgi:transposase-like protein